MKDRYDVIIIGAGAAGLTAAIYAGRRALKTLVISKDIGGQAATTEAIENYPGFKQIDGPELMTKFKDQAEQFGAEILIEEVTGLARQDEDFIVTSDSGQRRARAIIMAHGLTHRHLGVPGEEKFAGHGVSYCVNCDALLFRDKPVAVVGGGNSALDAALLLAKTSTTVTLINKRAEWRGEQVLIDRIKQTPNITIVTDAITKEIQGDKIVTGIVTEVGGQTTVHSVAGVFVEIGFTVDPQLIKDLVELDPRQQIIIDHQTNATNVPGIYAAGDVTTINQKQIVISAGEGAKAALAVSRYLQAKSQPSEEAAADWGAKK